MANTGSTELTSRRESLLSELKIVQDVQDIPSLEYKAMKLLKKCGVRHPCSQVPCIRPCTSLRDGRIIVRPQDTSENELTYVFSTLGPVTRVYASVWRFSNPLAALYDIYRRVFLGFARMARDESVSEASRAFYVEHVGLFRECATHLQRWKERPQRV